MARIQGHALTTRWVKQVTKPGEYGDGYGLALRIDARGNKRWIQRLSIDGKQRNMGLGIWPEVTLDDARAQALTHWQAAKQGRNPIEEKRIAQGSASMPDLTTFADAARRVIALRRPTWSNPKHSAQWESSLKTYVFPFIGDKPVGEVTPADVLAVLEPIWTAKPETAARLRQRMEVVFDYAITAGKRTDNPTRSIAKALPRQRRTKTHHPAMPYALLPDFMKALRTSPTDAVTQLALEFLILTAARSGEVRFMAWAEVDVEAAAWTVPAARMKARRVHRVPLSRRALEVLEGGPEPWPRRLGRLPVAQGGAPQQHGLHDASPPPCRGRCRPPRLPIDLQGLDVGADQLPLGCRGDSTGTHLGIRNGGRLCALGPV